MRLAALIALMFLVSPATATTHRIVDDRGGQISAYLAKYVQWDANGDHVVIAGGCQSACTLLLGMLDNDRVCATPKAVLGFHSASRGEGYAEDATKLMWFLYRGKAAKVLAKHGWRGPSNHPAVVAIMAREILRPCSEAELKGGD